MNYKLRGNFSHDETCIYEILQDRHVKNIEAFINPSIKYENNPYNLENITAAAELLLKHLRDNHSIAIVVDADNDGFTSAALIWNYIKQVFPNADLMYLLHEGKEHGIDDHIDYLIDEQICHLLIVPDAGSFNINCFWRLNKINTDVICLDHHEQMYNDDGSPITNNCPTAIVVNNQLSPNYPNKDFCGAGITYQFCRVLDDLLGIHIAEQFIDLAAVGNIGDVMFQGDPETRYIITEGLKHITNKGLQTLIQAQEYSLKEKSYYPYPGLTSTDVAFYICPLINAVVRVGTMDEKRIMFTALIDPTTRVPSTKRGAKSTDTESAAEQAARIAKNIKARQDRLKEKAIDLIDFRIQKEGLQHNNLIVVEILPEDNIPNELTGLIAQNIVSKYNRPAFVVRRDSQGKLKGSARNNGNFNALPALKSFLEQTGLFDFLAGHDNAHGLSIPESNLPALINYMNTELKEDAFANCYIVDFVLNATSSNTPIILDTIASHPDYYGNGIDEPRFIIKNLSLANIQIMGANKDSIKISQNTVDYVHFKDDDFVQEVLANRTKTLTVYGRANLNTYMGRTNLQFFIEDYEFEADEKKYEF